MKVMSLSFVLSLSLFFFHVLLPHRSLQPLAVLLLLSLLLSSSLLPHTVLLLLSFFAAAAVFIFFIKASHTQWNVTINVS